MPPPAEFQPGTRGPDTVFLAVLGQEWQPQHLAAHLHLGRGKFASFSDFSRDEIFLRGNDSI